MILYDQYMMLRTQQNDNEPTTSGTLKQQRTKLLIFPSDKHRISFGRFEEEMTVQEQLYQLTQSHDITHQAFEKASKMIELLQEERQELKLQLEYFQKQLCRKNQQILLLRQQLNSSPSIHVVENKQMYCTPKKNEYSTGSKLLFSFSQPTNISKRANPQIISPLTKQIEPGVIVSQELSPWNGTKGVFQQLAQVLSVQEIRDSALHQIEDVVNREGQLIERIQFQFNNRSQQLQSQLETNLLESQRQDLSSFKEYTSSTDKQEDLTIPELFKQYQAIITCYRSYAAHLRAYLCEAINYITSIASFISLGGTNFEWKIESIHHSIQEVIDKFSKLHNENKNENTQLKIIIEQMIKNITIIKRTHQSSQPKEINEF